MRYPQGHSKKVYLETEKPVSAKEEERHLRAMIKENNLQMSYFLGCSGHGSGRRLLFPSDQSFLTVIWPGSCTQQNWVTSLVTQSPYTGTPGEEGLKLTPGTRQLPQASKPVMGTTTTVTEFLLCARLWAESCICTIS